MAENRGSIIGVVCGVIEPKFAELRPIFFDVIIPLDCRRLNDSRDAPIPWVVGGM